MISLHGLQGHILGVSSAEDWAVLQAKATALATIVQQDSTRLLEASLRVKVLQATVMFVSSGRVWWIPARVGDCDDAGFCLM